MTYELVPVLVLFLVDGEVLLYFLMIYFYSCFHGPEHTHAFLINKTSQHTSHVNIDSLLNHLISLSVYSCMMGKFANISLHLK